MVNLVIIYYFALFSDFTQLNKLHFKLQLNSKNYNYNFRYITLTNNQTSKSQAMAQLTDQQLYEQMSKHPKAMVIHSKVPDQFGNEKDFKYLYVDDQKYMLGQGSFGRVFICFHEAVDRIVKLALKIIYIPQAYEQIKTIQHIVSTSRQQILALIKLRQNKHIIRIEDIIRSNNIIYIMLQFCNQRDLVDYFTKIKQKKLVDKQLIVRYYFAQILDAFKSLNKLNFMHRDIKPSNILVNNGILKIADFGLARQIIEGERQSFEEHVGTMITAAPQIVFKQQYSSKCDIYSLGVILYWMIYDRYPFEKVPNRTDFTQNKLKIPDKCEYFQVSLQMRKLLKQMLAYNESDRIDWVPLLQHQLFNPDNFVELDKKIRSHYDNIEMMKNRETYGRNFITHVSTDDQFLETTIPTSYYKFLREIQGQQKYNRCLVQQRNSFKQNTSLYSHKNIKDEYKNQDIKIKFYRTVLMELENLEIEKIFKRNKNQVQLIRTLLLYSIQKYLIYLMTKIKQELIFTIPPSIFNIHHLKQAEDQPLHRNFVQTVIQKVRGSEFTNKYSAQDVAKLASKCEQFKISQDLSCLFDWLNQSNYQTFLQQIDQCIIQMIYFIKPQIAKLTNSATNTSSSNIGPISKNPQFRSMILLAHHLFMFSMQDQVFPNRYRGDFPYSTFIETEQFKVDKNFRVLAQHILQMLARFQ